jgi:hypothetical protein
MGCQTYNDLWGEYETAVKLYTLAMRDMVGMIGEDFRLALKKLEQLRVKCRDAKDALTEHWGKDHNNLSHVAASV